MPARTRIIPLLGAIWWIAGCGGQGSTNATYLYYRDVKPIVDAKCVMCHHDGGVAPFALDAYDKVVAQKVGILTAVPARIMPPWPPGQGCTDYYADRSLSDDQIKTITG